MSHLTFKEYHALVTELVSELHEEKLDEVSAQDVADAAGKFVAGFLQRFKRKPTNVEMARMRAALRQAEQEKKKVQQRVADRTSASTIKPSGTTSAAAQGRHAEREWIDDILNQMDKK